MGDFEGKDIKISKPKKKEKKSFTDKYVDALKSQEKAYRIHEGKGFYIRVLPSGLKRFEFIYNITPPGMKKRIKKVMSLGNYPTQDCPGISLAEARVAFYNAIALFKSGIDPQDPSPSPKPEPIPVEALTIQTLYNKWEPWSKEPGRYSDRWSNTMRLAIIKDVLESDEYKNLLTSDVDPDIAKVLLRKKSETAPGQARNLMKAMSAMWTYAIEELKIAKYNPFVGLKTSKKIPAMKEVPRERVLADDEIRKLWQNIDKYGGSESTKRAQKLILLTGQRENEICGLQRSEIQFGKGKRRCKMCRRCGWAHIPGIRRQGNKGGAHLVFLSPLAMEIIAPTLNHETGYIFPGRGNKPIAGNSVANHVRRRVGKTDKIPHYGLAHWTIHDLRRTASTGVRRVGGNRDVMNLILGHKKRGIDDVYDQYEGMPEKEKYLTLWAEHVAEVLNSEEENGGEGEDY